MKQIEINVNDKIASLVNEGQFLVCGNNDYEVVFHFDEEWSGITAKTALFVFGEAPVAVPFDGNICKGISIENSTLCAIGVFAGDLKTSTGACIKCISSIRDVGGGAPKAPDSETYDKIMELLDKAMQAHTELPTGGTSGQLLKKKSEKDYDVEWVDPKDIKEIFDLQITSNEHTSQLDIHATRLNDHEITLSMLSGETSALLGRMDAVEASLGTAQSTLAEVVDGGAFV